MVDCYLLRKQTYQNIIPFFVFCLVGGTSAIVDISSLYCLSNVLDISDFVSISISYLLGLIVNYYLHTYFTFKKSASKSNLIKFIIVVCINYIITISLVSILVNVLLVGLILSKVITLPIIAVTGFLLSKLWVYNE